MGDLNECGMGYLNDRHRPLGHNSNNLTGKQVQSIINKYHIPGFTTFIAHNGTGSHDIILTSKNFTITPTSNSDPSPHLTIYSSGQNKRTILIFPYIRVNTPRRLLKPIDVYEVCILRIAL